MHELSLSSAIVNTVVKHAAGRRVSVVNLRVGALRQVVPDTLEFYFDFVAEDTVCEGATARAGADPGAAALRELRERVGDRPARVHVPALRAGRRAVEVASGNEFEVESIEVEEAECIAPR